MAFTIGIPQLGMDMSEGTLEEWLVANGATVAVGDDLYTLVTDKVETTVESPAAGVIRILCVPGSYEPGHIIAEIE